MPLLILLLNTDEKSSFVDWFQYDVTMIRGRSG